MIVTSVEDLRVAAHRALPRAMFEYIDRGSYDEQTLRSNNADLRAIGLRQRVGRNVQQRTTATVLLGAQATMPVAIAPTGLAGLMREDGEILAARAADRFGVPYTLSMVSICSIEDVAAQVTRPFWFQVALFRDRQITASLIERAKAAGCSTLVVTLDAVVAGQRHRDVKNGLSVPPRLTMRNALNMLSRPRWMLGVLAGRRKTFGNLANSDGAPKDARSLARWVASQIDQSLCWDDVRALRDSWSGKLVVKGILDPRDALEAVKIGADGIVVSNHGGRQLDGADSSIRSLPPVVDAVKGQCEVLLDSGIRSGRDVLVALALGARGCLIGKAHLYGLAAMGEAGVMRVLQIINAELSTCMALTGINTVGQVTSEVVRLPAQSCREIIGAPGSPERDDCEGFR
jgi:L-lactate dehydrogenase (cytochrome)